jgi:hypothetical protein
MPDGGDIDGRCGITEVALTSRSRKAGRNREARMPDEQDKITVPDTITVPAEAPPASAGPAIPPGGAKWAPTVVAPPPDYSQAGVPSLDYVRDKIEGRYAKSLGAIELAQETPEARSFEEQAAKRAEAAKEKLDAIRRSLGGGASS